MNSYLRKLYATLTLKKFLFLDNIFLPLINNDIVNLYKNDLTEDELLIFLKSMQKIKHQVMMD